MHNVHVLVMDERKKKTVGVFWGIGDDGAHFFQVSGLFS